MFISSLLKISQVKIDQAGELYQRKCLVSIYLCQNKKGFSVERDLILAASKKQEVI